jgi:hypothetical protein
MAVLKRNREEHMTTKGHPHSMAKRLLVAGFAVLTMALLVAGNSLAQTVVLSPGSQTVASGPGNSATINATTTGIADGSPIFFKVTAGPNAGTVFTGTVTSNAASFIYPDNKGQGTDTISACADGDAGSSEAADADYDECAGESGSDTADPLSDPVTVLWSPNVLVQNYDQINAIYSTNDAFNPVGSSHTVKVTVSGVTGLCKEIPGNGDPADDGDEGTVCTANTDCDGGIDDYCDFSGYLVGIAITGTNPQDKGFVTTGPDGSATISYTDTNGAGVDQIRACLDLGEGGFLPDDSDAAPITECINDQTPGDDIASNTVTKYWLNSFVTGGGKVATAKGWNTFGGVVGQKPGATSGVVGQWQETAHPAKGGNTTCHWNTFTKLAFTCTNGPCGTTPDTVQFVATGGKGGVCADVTVKIVDGRKKPDQITVTGGSILNVGPAALISGNFTLHP